VDRQKILNWVHSLQVLDPEMLQTKRIGGNPVADSVTTTTPPPIAEAAASISTLSVQPDAGVSTLYVHADLATRNSSSSMAREQETTAGCGSSGNGPLCLGADVLGFRGSPSIGVEYSTRGALKQSSYDCSHIAMTYTALAILATLKEDTVSSQGSATGGGADNAGCSLPDVRQHPVEGAGLLGEQVDERSSEGVGARGEDGNGVLGRREDGVCARGGDGVDTTAACSRAGEVRGMAKSLRELQLQDGSFMPVACGSESDMRFVFCAVQSVRFLVLIRTVSLSQHLLPCSPLPFTLPEPNNQPCSGHFKHDWVGGTLGMLGADHLIDFPALRSFLFTCQNTRYGGFSKHPGGFPDILHSFYGVCGFCLAGEPGLLPLHVPLGISKRAAACFNQG
ncbi:unnamed protein product, partial [Closterium sp. Naga37s-1]